MAPPTFSHSRLSSFESCPKKFQYRYVLRVPAPSESIEGFVGKRVHEVLERLYLAAGRGRVPSLRQVLGRYRQLWDAAFDAGRIRIVRRENSQREYLRTGERCLTNYYRSHYPFDADETLGLEKRVRFSLDAEGRYRFQGVVDRVVRARDRALEVHDYKTSQRVPTQRQLDRDRQLALYQIGVAEEYGADQPIRLVWHYLSRNQTRTSTRSPEQLERLRADTMGLIDRIHRERAFAPRPGPLCGWCEYSDRCPASTARPRPVAPAPAPPEDARGQLSLGF